jgi:hypothetical protein
LAVRYRKVSVIYGNVTYFTATDANIKATDAGFAASDSVFDIWETTSVAKYNDYIIYNRADKN